MMKFMPDLPPLPIIEPVRHYTGERIVHGVRYFYYRQYRCTVESWENDWRPKWELIKRPRKTWQPNL
jgi:hypothetical protein